MAVAQQLRKQVPAAELYFIGQGHELSRELSGLGVVTHTIMAGKWRRYHNQGFWEHVLDARTNWLNAVDLFKFGIGLAQSIFWLLAIRPQAVFTKGGFVSLPVGLAAVLLRRRLLIHESDVVPGLVNRWLAPAADVIATGWPVEHYPQWSARQVVYVGNPIRTELLRASGAKGRAAFKLDQALPTVLVVGGSSGAKVINEAVLAQASELTQRYQLLHLAGRRDYDQVVRARHRLRLDYPDRYQVFDYLDEELGSAIRAANVVVTRAGANFLAELAALAKPTIVVPSPHLAGGHQLRNAAVLARAGAVIELDQNRLGELARVIEEVLASREKQRQLSANFKQFAQPKAAYKLAKKIVQLAAGE